MLSYIPPTNPSSHGEGLSFLPPEYVAIRDHMGRESSFLPRSASFPSFSPKCNPNPSPQILSHLYVGKDSHPPQKKKNAKPPQILPYKFFVISLFCILFLFHLYHCFDFFVFFPQKVWNSSPNWKNYSPAFGANNRRIDAPLRRGHKFSFHHWNSQFCRTIMWTWLLLWGANWKAVSFFSHMNRS